MPGSSSTTRMLGMGRALRDSFRRNRKLDDEACSHRKIFLYANRAVVIFNDAAYDRQAQSGATVLGREVGQEQLFFQVWADAVTAVGDHNLHRLATADQR